MKKNLNLLLFGLVAVVFLLTSCAKEELIETNATFAPEVEQAAAILDQYNETAETPVQFSKGELQRIIVDGGDKSLPCAASDGCCFTQADLNEFLANYPCSMNCDPDWDLNCDGLINTADLTTLLAQFGCADVDPQIAAQLAANGVLYVLDQDDGVIKNYTTIDGVFWTSSTIPIDAARWYVNGVPVSTDIGSIQLEYPGSSPSDYDAAIPCNGYYEITLEILVQCKVYSETICIPIKLPDNPTCDTQYCTP